MFLVPATSLARALV
jgi:acyl carrier protein